LSCISTILSLFEFEKESAGREWRWIEIKNGNANKGKAENNERWSLEMLN
jgi:hypothetical protein